MGVNIATIEDAILARLESKGLPVRALGVQKGAQGIPESAVYVAMEEAKFTKITQSTFKQTSSIYLYFKFKNVADEKERRRGISPILQAAIGMLTLQNLGLPIDPLKPVSFRNITTEEDAKSRQMVYELKFETGYMIEKMDDEIIADLLRIGLEYYLGSTS